MKFAENRHGRAQIDLGTTSAVPEIHVDRNEQKIKQREAEKVGNLRIIKDGVAVPEVMRED